MPKRKIKEVKVKKVIFMSRILMTRSVDYTQFCEN